jgi:CRISPR/Cas system CMR-associated protein Cmr3 (group 5 of RAMP superfamily)
MATRDVVYKDSAGRKYLVQIPENAPDSHAKLGVRVGPPDLSELKLPLTLEVRLNNALFDRGLIKLSDVRRRHAELIAVWQAVLRVDSTVLRNLYEGMPSDGS